ncbi:MAG: hypothetical protein A2015_15725 [Spirochaetes bacterium GWF1_31_7]|nr:MAG: hypothetical protein A2Y30_10860 [Spirochaetes bacterium GWE1_32_154]OHD48252.1 MAG: hypothetical protein A2Y29_00495 [Spirochaetes bacterium GWE2_31_10]OHD50655.1 MAG: hypothetical protein A2015_15725 [Spirochaetes bacterium GWF1_31_7]OHD82135.1 MAG: hypothetical protein A2355_08040 [Spirochaetes bacterium RIFOXYB1_FULL_32_8]HBD96497.1 hypothetical protein [Spirochaetia bacterium]
MRYVSIIVMIVLFSCAKKIDGDLSPTSITDVVFTDSFSPVSYENPLSRRVIMPEDIDIGLIISPETSDPDLRAVYSFIDNFFKQLVSEKRIVSFFSDASFNSYRLRYGNSTFKGKYVLRVSRPELSTTEPFSVSYKIIREKSVNIGKFELTPINQSYIITDFEYKGFDELF